MSGSRAICATFLLGTLLVPASGAAEPPSLAELGIKGEVTFKNFSHFQETDNDDRNFRNEVILEVGWLHRWERRGSLALVLQARGDDAGFAEGVRFQIPDTNEHRSILAVKEAVGTLLGGPVEVTAGKQIFAWGTADAFNPTDRINPYDYLDVLDNEKLGVYSAAARLGAGPASLTFAVVPFFTPSRLPLPDDRWTPVPPPGFTAVVDDRDLPGRAVENMQYAARLKATVGGWDLSLSYYDGFDDIPAFRASPATVAPGAVVPRFTPVYTRVRVAGADFSTTWRGFEFHGEGAFTSVQSNGRQDDFQGIVGFSHTWDGLGWRWLERTTLLLEYARQVLLGPVRDPTILKAGDSNQVGDLLADNAFRDTVVGRLRLDVDDETQVELAGLLDLTRSPSYYAQLKVSHRLRAAWFVEAGLDVMGGAGDTFWGRWRDNDRFFFLLKYYF
ncbi:MAG: hypothetical protein ACREM3_20240 [Candidatus Rokuibacteriota bacterium]